MSKVFISYAREDLAELRDCFLDSFPRTITGLDDKAEALEVFIDLEGIPFGGQWREALPRALDASCAVVVLLSPNYADSKFALPVELKEIYARLQRGRMRVFPIVLSKLSGSDRERIEKVAPDIKQYQIAGHDVPLNKMRKEQPEEWRKTIDKLVGDIGIVSTLAPYRLVSCPYAIDEAFVERDSIAAKILEWEQIADQKLCVIAGGAGTGKTSFLAWLRERLEMGTLKGSRGRLLASHWCLSEIRSPASVKPAAFVKSIVAEMTMRHAGFCAALTAQDYLALARLDSDEAAEQAVRDIVLPRLNAVAQPNWLKEQNDPAEEIWYLLVDALDQTPDTAPRKASIARLIQALMAGMPRWMRIVVAIQRRADLMAFFPPDRLGVLHVSADRMEGEEGGVWEEVRTFVEQSLCKFPPQRQVAESGQGMAEAIGRIVTVSAGNFLVATYLLAELREGKRTIGEIGIAPIGSLNAYYRQYFEHYAGQDTDRQRVVSELLSTMLAAADAVPYHLLAHCFGQATLDDALTVIGPLLDQNLLTQAEAGLDFSHPQVLRWLREIDVAYGRAQGGRQAPTFPRIDSRWGHQLLARASCHKGLASFVLPGKGIKLPDLKDMGKAPAGDCAKHDCLTQCVDERTANAVSYAFKHGPRHMLDALPPDDDDTLLPCALDFLSVMKEHKGGFTAERDRNYHRHARALTIYIGEVFRGPLPPKWVSKTSDANLDALISHIGDVYETEILIGPMRLVFESFHGYGDKPFPEILDKLFADDYVMRFAMAMAMAQTYEYRVRESAGEGDRILRFANELCHAKEFHRRELGAYALLLICGKSADAAPATLTETIAGIADSETFPARSAFGDFLLNLLCQRIQNPAVHQDVLLRLTGPAFKWNWQTWEHNWRDAVDLAALAGLGSDERRVEIMLDAGFRGKLTGFDLKSATEGFERARNLKRELIAGCPPAAGLLTGYWQLGDRFAEIRRLRDQPLAADNLEKLMELLFLHPLWWVAEAAASTLASIADASSQGRDCIQTLLRRNGNWRVRYGAVEAAFDMRHSNGKLFHEAVKESYSHNVARVRALCAENLVGQILEEKVSETRKQLIETYTEQLVRWFGDNDCWVLEHPYRLLASIYHDPEGGFGETFNPLFDSIVQEAAHQPGALLTPDDWRMIRDAETMDREQFLTAIEKNKNGAN